MSVAVPFSEVPSILSDYVGAIWVSDTVAGLASQPYRVLPALGPVLGFQFRGRLSVKRATGVHTLARGGITGLQSEARTFIPDGPVGSVLVRFSSFGAYALLGCAMDELADQHVPLADLIPGIKAVEERVANADRVEAPMIVSDWLLAAHERFGRAAHADVVLAVNRIQQTRGGMAIARVVDDLVVGRRQLERLFKTQVGVGPKEFASLCRFDWTIRHLSDRREWADLAFAAGYADQAHFIRSFKRRTGMAPAEYCRHLCPVSHGAIL